MALPTHQRDFRCALVWGNTAKPDIAGSLTATDFDKTTLTTVTSQALPVEGFTYFNIDPKLRRVNRQTGKRFRTLGDTFNDSKGSIPGVTLSMPATKEVLDLFLYMALQRCAEGTTPFVKNFEYPSNTAISWASGRYPDFASDEGAFCGLVFQSQATTFSNDEEYLAGCVPVQLRLTCASDQHDGQLWLEADMIGRYWSGPVAYTGTVTAASTDPAYLFHINDIDVTTILGTSAIGVYGFGFTIDTGLMFTPFGGTGAGSKNMIMNGPNTSGFVDFLCDDAGFALHDLIRTTHLINQFTNASNQLAWGDGTTSTDGELDFTWIGQGTDIKPVGTNEMRFLWSFDCAEYSSNDAFKVNLCNGLDRGW